MQKETRVKLDIIKKIEQEINRDDLIYKTGSKKKNKTYDFQNIKTIRPFGIEICCGIITLNDAF